jgi:hypothetical protein
MFVILFEVPQYLAHVIVVLAAHGEAFDAVVVVVLDDLVCFLRVAEVVFVEDDEFLFLVIFYYAVKFWVAAAVGDAGVSDLHEDVHFVGVLFHHSQGFLHVARKPIYVVFQRFYDIHAMLPQLLLLLWI